MNRRLLLAVTLAVSVSMLASLPALAAKAGGKGGGTAPRSRSSSWMEPPAPPLSPYGDQVSVRRRHRPHRLPVGPESLLEGRQARLRRVARLLRRLQVRPDVHAGADAQLVGRRCAVHRPLGEQEQRPVPDARNGELLGHRLIGGRPYHGRPYRLGSRQADQEALVLCDELAAERANEERRRGGRQPLGSSPSTTGSAVRESGERTSVAPSHLESTLSWPPNRAAARASWESARTVGSGSTRTAPPEPETFTLPSSKRAAAFTRQLERVALGQEGLVLARLDPGHEPELVDQLVDLSRGGADHLHVARRGRLQRQLLERPREPVDRRERRQDVVAGDRDELGEGGGRSSWHSGCYVLRVERRLTGDDRDG